MNSMFLWVLTIFLQVGLPLLATLHLWWRCYTNFWQWLVISSAYGFWVVYIFLIAPWCMSLGSIAAYGMIGLFLLSYCRSFIVATSSFALKAHSIRWYCSVGGYGALAMLLTLPLYKVYQSRQIPEGTIALDFPLKGGRFIKCAVKLSPSGRRYKALFAKQS